MQTSKRCGQPRPTRRTSGGRGITGLRAAATVLTIAAIALGLGSQPSPAHAAVPIHIELPHVELPRAGEPLAPDEWVRGDALYEERLRAAGSEEALVVEESLRELTEERLREACRECAEKVAGELLRGELKSLVEAGRFLSLEDAAEAAIDACLSTQLPEYTPEQARAEFSAYLAQQLPFGASGASSQSADVSVAFAGTGTNTAQRDSSGAIDAGPPAGTISPHDSGSFPWGAAAIIGGCCAVALVLAAARKR